MALLPNTPVPQSFSLILHSSKARFISSGHPRKTIVSQSDESDSCLSAIRSVSDLHLVPSSDIFASSDHVRSDTSDTDLIVDRCITLVIMQVYASFLLWMCHKLPYICVLVVAVFKKERTQGYF